MQYNARHLKKVGQCRTGRHHDTYFAIKIQYVKDPHKISMENIFMGKTGLPPPPPLMVTPLSVLFRCFHFTLFDELSLVQELCTWNTQL